MINLCLLTVDVMGAPKAVASAADRNFGTCFFRGLTKNLREVLCNDETV